MKKTKEKEKKEEPNKKIKKEKGEPQKVEPLKIQEEKKKPGEIIFRMKMKTKTLQQYIENVSVVNNELLLKATKKGWDTTAVDPAHVALVQINLPTSSFDEYQASEELELGIDVDKMSGILKLAGETVELEYDQELNKMVIQLGNLKRTMGLIDTAGMVTSKMPTLNLPASVTIKTEDISKGVKASNDISDHLQLTITKDDFTLFSEGDTDDVTLKLPKDLLVDLKILSTEKTASSLFSIDYFNNIIKNASETITLNIGNDNPVKATFVTDGGAIVVHMLAPRIESK